MPPPWRPHEGDRRAGRRACPRVEVVEIEARKPRPAWERIARPAQVVSVLMQLVEIVPRGRHGDPLLNTEAPAAAARTDGARRPRSFIWTNGKLVELQRLPDEQMSATRDYRYHSKVDFV